MKSNMCGKFLFVLLAALRVVGCEEPNFWSYLNVGELAGIWEDDFPECGKDLMKLEKGIIAKEKWALEMMDASTKMPSGLLTGNFIDYGNYDECLGALPNGTGFRPQHCMASMRFPIAKEVESSLNIPLVYRWSYCLPDSCPAKVLERLLLRVLENFAEGANVTVDPRDCKTAAAATETSLSTADVLGISVWCVFACLAVASTIYDVASTLTRSEKNPWLSSFSVVSNLSRLLTAKVSADTLTPLDGMRFLSIAWIILGHRLYFSTFTPIMNMIEVPKEFEKLYFQLFAGGVLAVDTFFLLSGLLNSYLLLKLLDATKAFPYRTFFIHRYLRTTPALAAVVVMYSTWFVLLGSGPGWDQMTSHSKQLCVDHWWPTLLYINNYYNPVEQCAGQSWYLAVDMQLYWLSPLVIIPVWKWPKITKYYLTLLLVLSTIGQFLVAYIYKFRMSFTISLDMEENKRLTELLYVPTHTRATPYIIGIMLGVYLDGIRNLPERPKLSKVLVTFGWLASAALCLSVIFGNYPFFRSEAYHPYDRLESSLYIALHRIGWSLGISWVIVACLFGHGGIVNTILSWRFFTPLSRLTYCIFLSHIAVQQYQLGTMRATSYYQMFDEIHKYFGDLVLSIFAALVLSLLFESPFMVLEKLALGERKSREKKLHSYTNKAFQEI